jgi:hypothetical protein
MPLFVATFILQAHFQLPVFGWRLRLCTYQYSTLEKWESLLEILVKTSLAKLRLISISMKEEFVSIGPHTTRNSIIQDRTDHSHKTMKKRKATLD